MWRLKFATLAILLVANVHSRSVDSSEESDESKQTDVQKEFLAIIDKLYGRGTSAEYIFEYGTKAIKMAMNLDVNPCDDFYEFSCGKFAEIDNKDNGGMYLLMRKMMETVKDILLEPEEEPILLGENSYFRNEEDLKNSYSDGELKAKRYYRTCMDVEAKKARGMKPAIDFLKEHIRKPFGEVSENEETPWSDVLAFLFSFEEYVLFEPEKSYGKIISISRPSIELSFNFTLKSIKDKLEERTKQLDYVKKLLTYFEVEDVDTIAVEIVDFEHLLAEIENIEKERNYGAEMSLSEMKETYPAIDWETIVKKSFKKPVSNPKFDVDDKLFLKNLNYLIEYSPQRSVQNYIHFRFASALLPLTDKFEETKYAKKMDLSKFCFMPLRRSLDAALSALILRRFLNKDVDEDVTKMINDIDHEFGVHMDNVTWMSESEREALKEKASKTTFTLGLDSKKKLIKKIRTGFSKLEQSEDDYFQNALNMRKFVLQDTSYNSDSALVINAFYSPMASKRTFNLGFMLPTAYHVFLPKWVNYGNFGNTLAHELIHAFDSYSMLYKAKRRELQEFSLNTVAHYFTHAVCLARQYNSIGTGQFSHVDGIATLGENIADLGGLIITYQAYQKWMRENEDLAKKEVTADFDLTPEQLYFVSYAQTYCDTSPPSPGDVHTPNQKRAVGSMVNLDIFAEAFNCPADSPMNPTKKCEFL